MTAAKDRPAAPHRWWAPGIEDDSRPRLMFEYVRQIEERQSDVAQRMYRNAYLYTGEQISGLRVDWRVRPNSRPDIARINMTESLIETAVARTASRKPRLTSITRGGDWKLRQRARGLEQFLDGTRFLSKTDDALRRVFRDGASLGTGVGKVYHYGGQILTDRIFPLEIVVDELAALTTPPRQMFQRRFVDVDEACAEFGPEFEDDLWSASSTSPEAWTNVMAYEPYHVPIIEGYKLPSRPGAGDGCKMVAIGTKILVLEPWEYDHFPFITFRWQENLMGWYGRGIPDVVYWMQARLNRHAAFEAACQDRHANPRVLVDDADRDLEASMTNEIGVIIPSRGRTRPEFVNPPAVPPEIYKDEERKMEWMQRISGVTDFAASGAIPKQIESAPAQREYIAYTGGRFAGQEQNFDNMYVEWGYLSIDCAKELHAEGNAPRATWNSPRYGLIEVDWAKVDMERDAFRLRVLPTSAMSGDPSGLLQRLEEERAAGRLADDLYRYFVQTHDVEAYFTLYDAAVTDIMRTIDRLEDESQEFPAPKDYQALELGLWMVQMRLNSIDAADAPDTVLRRLSAWMQQAEMLVKMGKGVQVGTAPALGPGQAGGGPQGPQPAAAARLPMPGLAA